MKFIKKTTEELDFSTLKEGQIANATLKSFNFIKEWCFATFIADGVTCKALVGDRNTCSFSEMKAMKGHEVEIEYAGTTVSNGTTYPKFYVSY